MKSPPLLLYFDNADEVLSLLSTYDADLWASVHRCVDLDLPPVCSVKFLSLLFGFKPTFVSKIVRYPSHFYRVFEISTPGKSRTIQAPVTSLKVIQKWIASNLSIKLNYANSCYGFVPGRSAIDGARQHIGCDWAVRVDLKNFFGTTPLQLVAESLTTLGYSPSEADLLATLCSYNGFLAQGSPSSPVLSNLCFAPFDHLFEALASEHNIVYTRYADDLVFSGRTELVPDLVKRIEELLENSPWEIADHKTKVMQRPHRVKIYGLLVSQDRVRLTKGYRNRIRMYRFLQAKGILFNDRRIRGHLAYASQLED